LIASATFCGRRSAPLIVRGGDLAEGLAHGVPHVAVRDQHDVVLAEAAVEVRREVRLDVERERHVRVHVDALARRERDRLVDGATLVRRRRPDDVLHAGREGDELLGDRVHEDPARDDGHVLHAALASREAHLDAHVARVDAVHGAAADEEQERGGAGGGEELARGLEGVVGIEGAVHGSCFGG
jgi:hypothetical protein